MEKLRPRELMAQIVPYIAEPYPIVLIGVRRSGKSSLLALLMQHLLDNGVSPNQILLINFEEPLFSPYLSIEFLEALIVLYREKINPDRKIYFFLDEIQNLPEWEKWVRREADLKEHKIFLTGSSAKLLSSEIATLLTGRHYTFMTHPLSFKEYLNWREVAYQSEIEQTENKAIIRKALSEYLEWGGFPEVVLMDHDEKRSKILHQYFDDILFRDIVLRHEIRDVNLLQRVAEYYVTNMAALHSFNRIRSVFDTSIDNVRRYTAFLEESQLIFSLEKFSFKSSERQKASRKVYVADTGLRNAISFRFSRDIGRLIENVVAQQLLRQTRDLFYFGNASECDFVFKQKGKFIPLQVTYGDLSDEKLKTREVHGLMAAMRRLKQKEGLLLTDDTAGEVQIENLSIRMQPVWKFLCS
ncbi:MAG: ATP-binding protein [candidate division KSB1 bacterium]|nr:ATP-binding protein [candidate division KSB1 bacterium]MDZ7312034.1 ATP-binding protein [candidate division KSB1 bacterium]